ncbi:MAG: nucleotide pyrophosphohydrolase [candidate division WOR-3 bacterium]|nr:nucleotide pyrophosphohydrolase [candidate division WOR-3 bacterium]MCX7947514.1 nucleotide pyrophosphohydrolase [candidate division WOR-3 bacterium]MDW8150400.1 MazG nucleotide pyrophosphohydrolase domain-containing protein [candidate division WOR-3 bacterium]
MRIRHFQEIIRRTYYERDLSRGIYRTFIWSVEEFGELAKAINRKSKKEVEIELSDVIAWIFSVANLLDVDVENALSRYFNGCPKCNSMPCTCNKEVDFEGA